MCLDKGVESEVTVIEGESPAIDVYFNNKLIPGGTSITTIENLIGSVHKLRIIVKSTSSLPMSQGFGLSGAGALSTAYALDSALDLKKDTSELINAAHDAEIKNHSGLGDVVSQATGGIVLRTAAGGAGIGNTRQINLETDLTIKNIIVCTIGKELNTSHIITNPDYREKINRFGGKRLELFEKELTLENLFKQSNGFSKECGLLSEQLGKIIKEIKDSHKGNGAMVMLGNTVFAIGEEQGLIDILKKYGEPILCKIDKRSARKI
jgi:pantoate kinase